MNSLEEMISKTRKSMSTFWLMGCMRKLILGSLSLILRILRAMIETWLKLDLKHGQIVLGETGRSYSFYFTGRWNRRLNAWLVIKNRQLLMSSPIFQYLCPNQANCSSILLCTGFQIRLNACYKLKRKKIILKRKTISTWQMISPFISVWRLTRICKLGNSLKRSWVYLK